MSSRMGRTRIRVIALASSAMLASFLQTIMTPLVPSLPATFGVSAGAAAWVLTAALLAACATAPLSGRLGDVLGRRNVLLTLIALIVLGSVVGALSTTLAGVIVARVLQGVGLGVMALNVSVLRDIVPAHRLPAAVAAVSASNGIGGALGLPLSATVSEFFDWHGLFWLAAVLALASGLAILASVPHIPPTERPRIDLVGAAGLAVGMSGVVIAIAQGADWGWTSSATMGTAVAGLVVLALWVRHELRVPAPLIDLRTVMRGPVLIANLLGITVGFTWFAIPGLVARKLQSVDGAGPGLGLDMISASLVIVPTGLSMLIVAPLAQRLVRRVGTRPACILGGLCSTSAYLIALFAGLAAWQLAIVAALVGIASALVFSSLSLIIMANVPSDATAASNAVNAVFRWVGSTLSSAILGALLATHATFFAGSPVPTEDGYTISFAMVAAVGIAGTVLAVLLPRSSPIQGTARRS